MLESSLAPLLLGVPLPPEWNDWLRTSKTVHFLPTEKHSNSVLYTHPVLYLVKQATGNMCTKHALTVL